MYSLTSQTLSTVTTEHTVYLTNSCEVNQINGVVQNRVQPSHRSCFFVL